MSLGDVDRRRRWRAAFIALAALAVLTLACLPLTGSRSFIDYGPRAFALTAPQRIDVSPQNQTAEGALGRLLVSKSSWTRAEFAALWRARLVRDASAAFAAALVMVTAGVLWPRRARRAPADDLAAPRRGRDGRPAAQTDTSPREDQLGFGLVLAVSLVIGPFTFFHQFLWLLVLLLVIADRLIAARRWVLLALLVSLVLAVDLNELVWVGALWVGAFHHVWVWPYREMVAAGLWRALSVPFLVTVALWAAGCAMVVAGRLRPESAPRWRAP